MNPDPESLALSVKLSELSRTKRALVKEAIADAILEIHAQLKAATSPTERLALAERCLAGALSYAAVSRRKDQHKRAVSKHGERVRRAVERVQPQAPPLDHQDHQDNHQGD